MNFTTPSNSVLHSVNINGKRSAPVSILKTTNQKPLSRDQDRLRRDPVIFGAICGKQD